MVTLRRLFLVMTVCVSLLIPAANPLLAQPPAAAPQTAGALPSNSTVVTRPMYVEGVVVILLMAGAVFAVCRSSRRM